MFLLVDITSINAEIIYYCCYPRNIKAVILLHDLWEITFGLFKFNPEDLILLLLEDVQMTLDTGE
jgi:hypothetical protein